MIPITEQLNPLHIRNEFSCGNVQLDHYLKYQAGQDIRRKLSVCFVMRDPSSNVVKGYYTLANSNIPAALFSEKFRSHFPGSYASIPATLLGRLAVDKEYQGKGTGKLLLLDALRRSYQVSGQIGSFAVVVDPIGYEAQSFYSKYGFIQLPDSGKMFIPMKTISRLFIPDEHKNQ